MTNRRAFVASLAALTGSAAVASALPPNDVGPTYEPAGLLEPNTIAAMDIDYVTLDGVKQEHVLRAHDVEGWVEVLIDYKLADGRTIMRQHHRRGVVRFHYLHARP